MYVELAFFLGGENSFLILCNLSGYFGGRHSLASALLCYADFWLDHYINLKLTVKYAAVPFKGLSQKPRLPVTTATRNPNRTEDYFRKIDRKIARLSEMIARLVEILDETLKDWWKDCEMVRKIVVKNRRLMEHCEIEQNIYALVFKKSMEDKTDYPRAVSYNPSSPRGCSRFAASGEPDVVTVFRQEVAHIGVFRAADVISRLFHRWKLTADNLGVYFEAWSPVLATGACLADEGRVPLGTGYSRDLQSCRARDANNLEIFSIRKSCRARDFRRVEVAEVSILIGWKTRRAHRLAIVALLCDPSVSRKYGLRPRRHKAARQLLVSRISAQKNARQPSHLLPAPLERAGQSICAAVRLVRVVDHQLARHLALRRLPATSPTPLEIIAICRIYPTFTYSPMYNVSSGGISWKWNFSRASEKAGVTVNGLYHAISVREEGGGEDASTVAPGGMVHGSTWSSAGMKGGWGTPKKTRRRVVSSGTIPTCKNPGVTWFALVGGEQVNCSATVDLKLTYLIRCQRNYSRHASVWQHCISTVNGHDRRRAAGEVTSEYQSVKSAAGRLDYWTRCASERHYKLWQQTDCTCVNYGYELINYNDTATLRRTVCETGWRQVLNQSNCVLQCLRNRMEVGVKPIKLCTLVSAKPDGGRCKTNQIQHDATLAQIINTKQIRTQTKKLADPCKAHYKTNVVGRQARSFKDFRNTTVAYRDCTTSRHETRNISVMIENVTRNLLIRRSDSLYIITGSVNARKPFHRKSEITGCFPMHPTLDWRLPLTNALDVAWSTGDKEQFQLQPPEPGQAPACTRSLYSVCHGGCLPSLRAEWRVSAFCSLTPSRLGTVKAIMRKIHRHSPEIGVRKHWVKYILSAADWNRTRILAVVFATPVDDVGVLRNRIMVGYETIRNFPGVRESMLRRVDACVLADGGNFEHLL
ncbi:hypothetical protein PR048_004387 [Dryococelus australis]|uniref:Uncharacterized protein n=1 Tax=Dryococelus australis TaxID=614101 RepID=A0ABQ9I788_9NEOP|nr:hypothetical protein PR048_004387 [Dryococelus australis]